MATAILLPVILVLGVIVFGSTPSGSAPTAPTAPTASAPTTSPGTAGASLGDPCALLTEGEAAALGLGSARSNSGSCFRNVGTDGGRFVAYRLEPGQPYTPSGSFRPVRVGNRAGTRYESVSDSGSSCNITVGISTGTRLSVTAHAVPAQPVSRLCDLALAIATAAEARIP